MKNEMKYTILNQLNTLPDGYRELAIENLRYNHAEITPQSDHIADSLALAFFWAKTKQGYRFWRDVQKSFIWQKEINKNGKITPGYFPPLPKLQTH